MINGVSLSQIEGVNLTQLSHYRRIAQVENGTYSRISQLDPQLIKIVQNRRTNHQKWKRFHQARYTTEIERSNNTYRNKLQKIKLGRSVYAIDRRNSPMHNTKPSNFYNRKRYQEVIDNSNPSIAHKIINVKGTFNHGKTQQQYSKYRDTVHRLQRFSVFQRMTSFSHRKTRIKTEGDKTIRQIVSMSPSFQKKISAVQTPKRYLNYK